MKIAATLCAAAVAASGGVATAVAQAGSSGASVQTVPSIPQLNCSQFNASKIKLVTFDVFAALMDIYSSLYRNVPLAVPGLSASQAQHLADTMIIDYGQYANHVFTEAGTGGLEPFAYVARTSTIAILKSMNLTSLVPTDSDTFNNLLATWENLIPWDQTAETIAKIAAAGFEVAPLSNGDAATLTAATSIFPQMGNASWIFSSNFPVGAFKPQAAMYAQLLTTTGYASDEVLHCAGAPGDGQGAREYGLFSALLHNKPISVGVQPCFPLANITLLPAVLGIDDRA